MCAKTIVKQQKKVDRKRQSIRFMTETQFHFWRKKSNFFPEFFFSLKITLTYLETLDFESQLQCIDEKNKSHPVLNHESRMIQFIYDFLPVQGGLQLVHSLYEDFHVPGFGFVDLVLFP